MESNEQPSLSKVSLFSAIPLNVFLNGKIYIDKVAAAKSSAGKNTKMSII